MGFKMSFYEQNFLLKSTLIIIEIQQPWLFQAIYHTTFSNFLLSHFLYFNINHISPLYFVLGFLSRIKISCFNRYAYSTCIEGRATL